MLDSTHKKIGTPKLTQAQIEAFPCLTFAGPRPESVRAKVVAKLEARRNTLQMGQMDSLYLEVDYTKLTLPALGVPSLLVLVALVLVPFLYYFAIPSQPPEKGVPPLATGELPFFGSTFGFFNRRWDFMKEQGERSRSGNFSFFLGRMFVVALTGDKGRDDL